MHIYLQNVYTYTYIYIMNIETHKHHSYSETNEHHRVQKPWAGYAAANGLGLGCLPSD